MSQNNSIGLILGGLFLGLGLTAGGYFASQTLYNAKVAVNVAEAKGLSERRVTANRANWTLVFKIAGKSNTNVPALYEQAENQQKKIITFLKDNEFKDKEIKTGTIDYTYQEFRDDKQVLVDERHQLTGTIDIETDQVDLLLKVRSKINKLIADGIYIENQPPKYFFTDLNTIKPEMLKEATENARVAASEFATNAGVKVGRIQSAVQGGFVIRDAGEEYGDTVKLEKDIRLVTTIKFYLTD